MDAALISVRGLQNSPEHDRAAVLDMLGLAGLWAPLSPKHQPRVNAAPIPHGSSVCQHPGAKALSSFTHLAGAAAEQQNKTEDSRQEEEIDSMPNQEEKCTGNNFLATL